ncbi:uncharacterized protein BO95DRAFT_169052 [Aspergillus brunneoviolaceus CBS 621.78]|uniref:Uncharacterized protein n=1 Tax=Aspergillus brunneoviolaceus CBS 621.78 TaxID=1450534 RepID=A0ACD1G642_9EURO|nr:hypothetical protein BO95DRAFT_169052 [Aspergillus brunneoviolaceus CBS 621.78]RAH44727.1 hypothetical protein BO95DRAFT_169052 [Aspergillus brunneoviolaceus CBS 621.78]
MLNLVTLHANLVRSDDRLQSVLLTEALGDVGSELKTNTALAGSTTRLGLRVGPEHLHHQPLLARLALVVAVQLADIIEGSVVVGEETTVENKVLVTDQRGQGQSGEGLREDLEGGLVVLSLALALKTVHLIHVVRLVVATVQEDAVGSQPLVRVEKQSNLSRPRPPIHKVTVEEISIRLARVAVQSEDLKQVEVLSCPTISLHQKTRKQQRARSLPCVSPQTVKRVPSSTPTSTIVGSA